MNRERRQRIEELFEAAISMPPEERPDWLAGLAEGERELIAEVESLLAAHGREDGILEREPLPAVAFPAETPNVGERFGAYRIVGELGRGGMGVVYLAERDDGQFRRSVAIKLIGGGRHGSELYERFEAERQILAALDHPNIAHLLDGGLTAGGLPYLVMEHVDGLPIDEHCDRNRLTIDERLQLFTTVAHAVHHAHRNLVVHRDLKPSNIFVTADGVVKLLDFGIAKILDPSLIAHDAPLTRSGVGLMTPEYASPEQFRGDPITTASDVYALGVVLYKLLSGRRPYNVESRSLIDWARLIIREVPVPPSEAVGRRTVEEAAAVDLNRRLRRRLRGDLDRIVLMALRKEPEQRYPSAEQMAEDIERHMRGLPVAAHRGTRWYRFRKFTQRHLAETVAAALVAISLLAGAGLASWQGRLARQERDRAEAARLRAEQALSQSRDVTAFLIDLFEASDPSEARADTIAAREILRRGARRIEELAAQPLVQARMLDALGRVYENLGQYAQAQHFFERSLVVRRSVHNDEGTEVAASLKQLGMVLTRRGEYVTADSMLRRALAIERAVLGESHPDIARTLYLLGFVAPYLGKVDDAVEFYRESLEMRRQTLGREDSLVANSLIALGSALRRRGDIEGAERCYREGLALRQRVLGPEDPAVAEAMLHLGDLLREHKGENEEAEVLYQVALTIQRRALGDDHLALVHTLGSLASLFAERGDLAAAESLQYEVLKLQTKVLGTEHPSVAGTLGALADLLLEDGQYAEAEAQIERALTLYRKTLGDQHYAVASTLGQLAKLNMLRGDYDTAERLYRDVLARRLRAVGPQHALVALDQANLAELLTRRGLYQEAEQLLEEALRNLRADHTDEHINVRRVLRAFAGLYDAWGRPAEAERYHRLARDPSQP